MTFHLLKKILVAAVIAAIATPMSDAFALETLLSITHESVTENLKDDRGRPHTQFNIHLLNKADQRRFHISITSPNGSYRPTHCSLEVLSAKGKTIVDRQFSGAECQSYYDALVAGTTSELNIKSE